jgi:RNA polymerase sigma-B factor
MTDPEDRLVDEERSVELFERLPHDPGAREGLVELHFPLVEYLARRFAGRGEPVEDLVQVGSIGLLKAIDRFDPERGVKFSTYATPTIIGELKRHFRDKGWAMRVPRRLQEIGLQLSRVVSEMYQELGRSPTVPEIASRSGLSEDDVLEGMDAIHVHSIGSLDAPTEEDGQTSMARLGEEEGTYELLEGWASVEPHLQKLPERERSILFLRFVRGLTQSQIAEKLGISQMHVSRILSRTLRNLREAVGVEDL